MLRLWVRDNNSGTVHEYGTNRHDALILQEDGSLHYENMQCCAGTKFPKEGYSFCREDGTIPDVTAIDGDEFLDIGGVKAARCVDTVPVRCKNCDWFREQEGRICVNPKATKSFYGCPVPEDHFCSYGEPRKDGNVCDGCFYPKAVVFESDYAPGTALQIVQTDDGDIVLKIRGSGEMRIATSGGKLRGKRLVDCIEGFGKVIAALEKKGEEYDEA